MDKEKRDTFELLYKTHYKELYIHALSFVRADEETKTEEVLKETTEENEDACFGHIIKSVKECREGEDEIMKYYSSHEFFEEGKNKRKVFGL